MKKTFKILLVILALLTIVGCNFSSSDDGKDMVVVSFDSRGGSKVKSIKVERGEYIDEPAAPTKKDANFVCWLLNDQTFSFNVPITDNITLVAKWDNDEEIIDPNTKKIVIYSVNDFHGAIKETKGSYGISRMGAYIKTETANTNQVSIVVSAGDMFQGSALSNYRYGLDIIKIMNNIKFDAMTIGNHEFDWTLDRILSYRDGNTENGEANFPFLGCNIIQKSLNGRPQNVDDYVVVERGGVKVGIVGYIGYGEEKDIATQMIKDYYFKHPLEECKRNIYKLRTEEKVDIVIVVGHDSSEDVNYALAQLEGDYKVNALINGHTHLAYVTEYNDIYAIQSGSSGYYVGKTTLMYDNVKKKVTSATATNVSMETTPKDTEIDEYVAKIVEETNPFFEKVIGIAGSDLYSRYDISDWAVNAIKEKTNADIAFTNYGGLRAAAFPINRGDPITISKMYEIMPFDNAIKVCTMKGSDVKLMMQVNDFAYTGLTIDNNKEYRVAAVDYIFDKDNYLFKKGTNQEVTGLLFRDIMIEAIEELTKKGEKWL